MIDEQVGRRWLTSRWIALILVAASVSAAPWAMSRLGFRGFVAVYAIAVAAWPFARRIELTTSAIIIIALALRLPMTIHAPLLSGDVYRYLADGSALASGTIPTPRSRRTRASIIGTFLRFIRRTPRRYSLLRINFRCGGCCSSGATSRSW